MKGAPSPRVGWAQAGIGHLDFTKGSFPDSYFIRALHICLDKHNNSISLYSAPQHPCVLVPLIGYHIIRARWGIQ